MRPVVLQVFDYSLDGIIGVGGSELFEFCRALPDDPAYEAWLMSSLESAGVHIMGRVTYEEMAGHFPVATAADHQAAGTTDDIAEIMNRTPKAVFSRTLTTADWPGTTIISGDTVDGLNALREQGSGVILAQGGVRFAQSLAALDVVDEYRLSVAPFLAGSGPRLFTEESKGRALELVSTATYSAGLQTLVYRRRR
jgi:dihydrofolate reductase